MFTFKYVIDGKEVTFSTDIQNCTDLVRDIYYFLLGTSYHPSTILEAMKAVVEEYEEANSSTDQ